ncbi:MAG: hypothetical protein Q8P72_05300 [Candidatus Roizmanbacteria bacterium]|nr:hypothetical protein [Candidatus Roizmanbacteria bacterium]
MSTIQVESGSFIEAFGSCPDEYVTGLSLIFNSEGIANLPSEQQIELGGFFLTTVCQALCGHYNHGCKAIEMDYGSIYKDRKRNPNVLEFVAKVNKDFDFDDKRPCQNTQIYYGESTP